MLVLRNNKKVLEISEIGNELSEVLKRLIRPRKANHAQPHAKTAPLLRTAFPFLGLERIFGELPDELDPVDSMPLPLLRELGVHQKPLPAHKQHI